MKQSQSRCISLGPLVFSLHHVSSSCPGPDLVSRGIGLHNFVHPRLELSERKRLLQIGKWRRILAHRLIILDAAPLGVHHDLTSVETTMQTGGNETRLMAHRGFGGAPK